MRYTLYEKASTQAPPIPIREHATRLSTYLQNTLSCIERTNDQPVPANLVKTIIHGTVTFILKTQHAPDLNTVCDALNIAQTEAKAAAESTVQALSEIRSEVKNTTEAIRQTTTISQQTLNTEKKQEPSPGTRPQNKELPSQAGGVTTYATVAARGSVPTGIQNTQSIRVPSVQTQREVVVNIRNTFTIQNLRAINPRNLKAHSGNKNLVNVKIVSSNQLKSGDLSIRTASSNEAEALKQFADNWAQQISSRATVQIPTYSILAHGIRTSSLDLTRNAPTKSASTIIVEFTKAENANKIIDEGLVWQGESKATTACGYCAQEHDSRNCSTRTDRNVPKKCATCRGDHKAWSRQSPTRKKKIAKVKAAYDSRLPYHTVPETSNVNSQPATAPEAVNRNRTGPRPSQSQEFQMIRTRSQARRGQKRTNTENTTDIENEENQVRRERGSQRPQRTVVPSRRAIEAIKNSTQPTRRESQQIDIDKNTET
ncbi:hypothetical protein BS50DRAFT_659047 [Corynespora cassiicola Philippines]|uniref:Gag-like protein n=1 Tax=Corynespora cassiicola Philippines TaxID=1448308 RepID=A0A2T2N115_CORCC|nr:hypothetical protein BS50DRAFT_659047 [Corynespora cassiicola Philippines]